MNLKDVVVYGSAIERLAVAAAGATDQRWRVLMQFQPESLLQLMTMARAQGRRSAACLFIRGTIYGTMSDNRFMNVFLSNILFMLKQV